MQKRSGAHAPHWEDLLTLAVLVRSGSYSAAAREMGLTHATVSRRLTRLETALGTHVLERRDGRPELTETGWMALTAAEEMERAACRLDRVLETRPAGLSGRVRLTATEALGTWFYLPRLEDFHRRYPGLALDLTLDSRSLSLARRKADLAIRLARPEEDSLVSRLIGYMDYGLYISGTHPRLAGIQAGETPPLCRFDETMSNLPESRWLAAHLPEAPCVFRSNSLTALFQAVVSGWGCGLLPCFMADGDSRLYRLLPGPVVSREIWLAYPEEFRSVPRYRAVIDWLTTVSSELRP